MVIHDWEQCDRPHVICKPHVGHQLLKAMYCFMAWGLFGAKTDSSPSPTVKLLMGQEITGLWQFQWNIYYFIFFRQFMTILQAPHLAVIYWRHISITYSALKWTPKILHTIIFLYTSNCVHHFPCFSEQCTCVFLSVINLVLYISWHNEFHLSQVWMQLYIPCFVAVDHIYIWMYSGHLHNITCLWPINFITSCAIHGTKLTEKLFIEKCR